MQNKTLIFMKNVKGKNGDVLVVPLLLIVGILLLGLFLGELMRYIEIHDEITNELNTAVNLSIKEAMFDSYRVDVENKLDEVVAKEAFYNYLYNEMNLNKNLEKKNGNELRYKLVVDNLNINSDNVKMTAKGVVVIPGWYGIGNIDLKYKVTSANVRIDGL